MNKIRIAAAAVAFTSLATAPSRSYAWGIDFQDTYVNLRFVPANKDPGFSQNAPEIAGNISYANGWTYGSNFVSLDFENFSRTDRANGVNPSNPFNNTNTNSSDEFYGVFRSVLSGNKISGTQAFSFGPVRDVGLEIGGDWATQDDQFATNKKLFVFGPQFSINLPRGFWTISTVLSKEWNNNAFINTGTSYDVTGEIETAFSFPFAAGPIPLNFTGFADFIGPKGKGATNDSYHHVEILLHPKLMVDVGELLGYVPKKIEAGVGYEYWHNKFGNPSYYNGVKLSGTEQNSVFVEIGYHF